MERNHLWVDLAACYDRRDLDWVEPTPAEEVTCRQLCARCPVRADCLEAALAMGEPWGIWGGLDAVERTRLAVTRGMDEPRILPSHGTNSRYAKHGCRCEVCRAAHTEYERERRERHHRHTSAA